MISLLPLLLAAGLCPAGSSEHGAAPPKGVHQWCESKDGKKQGPDLEWYAGGAKKSVGSWKDGKMHGHWQGYREDGTLFLDESYDRGEAVAGVAKPASGAAAGKGSMGFGPGPRDPDDHPRAAELRAAVLAQPAAQRAEAAAGVDQAEQGLRPMLEGAGGTLARSKDGKGRDVFSFDGPKGAGKITFALDLQLATTLVVDKDGGRCTEETAFADPKKKEEKPSSKEQRILDCRTLVADPFLGRHATKVLAGQKAP